MGALVQALGYENVRLYSDLFDKMQPDREVVVALLAECQPESIVEIGCGSGRLLPLYRATRAKSICGIDVEADMVARFADTDDARVKARCGDIRQPLAGISPGSMVVLTSSLLKHLLPADRSSAWSALAGSVAINDAIYVDHCSYVYGIERSTDWQSYDADLRVWWPEDFWPDLRRYSWRKEVSGQQDILEYRHENGATARIVTYAYPLDDFLADMAAAGFRFHSIADRFPGVKNLHGMERRIGLLSRRSDDFWGEVAQRIGRRLDTPLPGL